MEDRTRRSTTRPERTRHTRADARIDKKLPSSISKEALHCRLASALFGVERPAGPTCELEWKRRNLEAIDEKQLPIDSADSREGQTCRGQSAASETK